MGVILFGAKVQELFDRDEVAGDGQTPAAGQVVKFAFIADDHDTLPLTSNTPAAIRLNAPCGQP